MYSSNVCGDRLSPPSALGGFPYSRHRCSGACEFAALATRAHTVEIASCATRAALKDMPIGAVAIDRLVAAEQTRNSIAATHGGGAGLLNGCKHGTSNHGVSTYAGLEVGL